ncbi:C-myc promoter-binding protein-like [Centruroides sculpturatus]|uniref:C-myc promoter-binding protein-like n=1 Tax=Centruroides sculpturatus TaxID=218467 RepID=UPI000C6E4FF1|nr:C-myc promoter-binding protein-like [Centruroides sculpturatus]
MASILKGFRSYLLPITKAPTVGTTDPSSLFDLQGFLRSRDKAYHRFFVMMMKTQMFIRFIEERSFVSDKDACLAFFDECTEKVDETGAVRLLEFESQQSDRTVFIAPPEPYGLLSGITYTYHEFGVLNPQLFHRHPEKTLLSVIAQENSTPNSPLARRTKQEIKLAQKVAKKQAEIPPMWAKCLVGYCYSLWFIHLPAFTKTSSSKSKALRTAYDILVKLQSLKLHPPDEVCYRVLMLLCGLYSQPVLAVRVLFEMKRNGVQPNAITYGYYNKAVLESTWPSADSSATLMWNKLRNVVLGVAQFRQGVKKKARRSLSLCSELDYDRISRTSTESSNPEEIAMIKIHPTEFVYDLIKVDDQSSGGQSDGGYSSMNPEEAQKIASHLAAAQSSEFQAVNGKIHCKDDDKVNKECNAAKSLKFEELDFSASDAFRSRVGSIVRSSASSLSNLSKLHDTIVDSSAGVLMTSHATLIEDSMFEEGQNVQSERLRKRHKSDPNYRAGRAYRLRHCSCSLMQGIGEGEHPRQFFRSNSFGNDVQIIRKIRNGTEVNCELQDSVGKLDDKCMNKVDGLRKQDELTINTGAFGLSRCDEECEEELEAENSNLSSYTVLPRPKSPNIPIKRRNSTSDFKKPDDSLGMLNSNDICYGNYSLNNIEESIPRERDFFSTTLSPLKEAWFNWDFFAGGNLPKMASSLTYSLGLANSANGEVKGMSPLKNSKVTRSSTFHGASDNIGARPVFSKIDKTDDLLDLEYSKKPLSRSSTLPVTQKTQNSPKVIGGRNSYSGGTPSGLSRFTSRHSEILFDSLKSAASSVANKFSEFRQSLSASNTPTKGVYNSLPKPYEMEKLLLYDDDDQSCSLSENRRASVDYVSRASRSDDVFSSPKSEYFRDTLWSKGDSNIHHVGSAPAYSSQVFEMMESHYESSSEKISSVKVALDITMTSCSRCYTCYSILYDEEIMEGWSADDSNLNTQCAFCKAKLVPLLTIIIRDLRNEGSSESLLSPAHSAENILNNQLDSAPINESNKRKSSLPQNKIPLGETDFNRNNSIDSCNEAFLLFEESPESRSPASDSHSGTPLGSPTKQISENYSSRVPHSLPQDVKPMRPSGADLIKLDSPDAALPLFNPNSIGSIDNQHSSNSVSIVKKAESWNSSTQNFLGNPVEDTELPASLPSSIKSTSRLLKPLSATSSGADLRRLGISDIQALEPITVPYLSPLVLRKEMENILEHEGDNCLTKSEFVDQHPIIYWNLVWFFKRINVPSHLPNLCLEASSITKNKQMTERNNDFKNVIIRCLWDNVKWHEDIGQPMYLLWTQNTQESSLVHALVTDERQASKSVMKQILARIQNDDLISPINLIINQRRKCHLGKGRHHSIYRELLYLSLVALGRENIDIVCFDREYNRAFGKLTEKQISLLHRNDRPLSPGASFCRHYFRELELITA